MQRLANFVVQRRLWVLTATLLVTVILASGAQGLRVVIDTDATLPQDHRFVQATNEVERVFGNKYAVVIGIRSRDGVPLTPAVLAATEGITKRIAALPGVVKSRVLSLAADRAKDITGTSDELVVTPYLEDAVVGRPETTELLRRIKSSPAFRDLLVSEDGSATLILADFAKDREGFRAIEAKLRDVVAPFHDDDTEIAIGGQPMFLAVIERYSDRMGVLFPLAVLLIGLIHFEAFRSLQGLLLPLVTGILASIWAMGILGWADIPLDAFNVSTPILILAVAAGHAVQLLKRYYEELSTIAVGLNPTVEESRLAIVISIVAVGPTLVAAGTIAALSFLSLALFGIESIRNFGIFTALGITSAVLIELTFMPSLRACLRPPRPRHLKRERADGVWGALVNEAAAMVSRHHNATLLASVLVVVVALIGATQIRADNSLRYYFADDEQVRVDDARINGWLAGSNVLYVLIGGKSPDAMKRPDVLQAIARTTGFLSAEKEVGKVISLSDFVGDVNGALAGGEQASIPATAAEVAEVLFLYSLSGDPEDFDSVVDYGYQNSVITAFIRDDSYRYLKDLEERLLAFTHKEFPADVAVKLGGTVLLPSALNETLVKNKLLNIVQIFLVVMLISSAFFRSWSAGLLVVLPLAMSTVVNFGIMGFSGIPLQLSTAAVSASAIGIGADFSIYILFRLRQELAAGRVLLDAVLVTYRTAGRAVLYVATAVAAGYAIFMVSPGFYFHLWMGLLFSVAISVSAITALTTFMALIVRTRPAFLGLAGPTSIPVSVRGAAVVALLVSAAAPNVVRDAWADGTGVAELMERNYHVSKVRDSSADVLFRLVNASGQERVRRTKTITRLKDGSLDAMRLARFVEPADIRGTATLTIENAAGDDDIWIYLPTQGKTRRITASDKRDSYVGTDFTYGDIIGYAIGDWTNRAAGEEWVDGADCVRVEAVPATPEVLEETGYSRRVLWVSKSNAVTLKGEYYDRAGALLKTYHAFDVVQVDATGERWQPMRYEMRNVRTGHRTEIVLSDFKANVGIEASIFVPRSLEREE